MFKHGARAIRVSRGDFKENPFYSSRICVLYNNYSSSIAATAWNKNSQPYENRCYAKKVLENREKKVYWEKIKMLRWIEKSQYTNWSSINKLKWEKNSKRFYVEQCNVKCLIGCY